MIDTIILNECRNDAFKTCTRFINYELVPGDICEFGVYTGRSLALLSYHNSMYFENENTINKANIPDRKCYGFDSWDGLPEDNDNHPRWVKGLFSKNHSYHPTIKNNAVVTTKEVINFFKELELPFPNLIQCEYTKLHLPTTIHQIALVHIDCDLYESTKNVLNLIKNKLVEGTIIMFDDWFNYKANPNKGEQKAFNEFLKDNTNIKVVEFLRYATFCKAFVVIDTKA